MDAVEIVIGAVLTIVVAALAEKYEGRTRKALWIGFVVLVGLLAVVQIIQRKRESQSLTTEQTDRKNEADEYKRDRSRFISILDSGQQTLALLAQEFGSTNTELKRLTIGPTGTVAAQNAISNLSARAQLAEQTAAQLKNLYLVELDKQNWPLPADQRHPGLWLWFFNNFKEALDLNGVERFYLYYLLKHNGQLTTIDQEKELDSAFLSEFPSPGAPATFEARQMLTKLGFIETWEQYAGRPIAFNERLKEPYFSRFKNQAIP